MVDAIIALTANQAMRGPETDNKDEKGGKKKTGRSGSSSRRNGSTPNDMKPSPTRDTKQKIPV